MFSVQALQAQRLNHSLPATADRVRSLSVAAFFQDGRPLVHWEIAGGRGPPGCNQQGLFRASGFCRSSVLQCCQTGRSNVTLRIDPGSELPGHEATLTPRDIPRETGVLHQSWAPRPAHQVTARPPYLPIC